MYVIFICDKLLKTLSFIEIKFRRAEKSTLKLWVTTRKSNLIFINIIQSASFLQGDVRKRHYNSILLICEQLNSL